MKTTLMMIATIVATGLSGPAYAANCAPREAVVVRLDEQLVRSGERGQREREVVHGLCG